MNFAPTLEDQAFNKGIEMAQPITLTLVTDENDFPLGVFKDYIAPDDHYRQVLLIPLDENAAIRKTHGKTTTLNETITVEKERLSISGRFGHSWKTGASYTTLLKLGFFIGFAND